jgi:hypothetical protein
MMENIFYINENGRLTFDRLDFEMFVADVIEHVEPKNIKDLKWMAKMMIESIQLCASDYVYDSDDIEDEWEDVYYPNNF